MTFETVYSEKNNITITLASLGNGSGRQSDSVSNTNDKFIDVAVGGKITTGTSPTADTSFKIYAFGSIDGGLTFTDNASGTDSAWTTEDNARLLDIVQVDGTSDKTYEFGPYSMAATFGGAMPRDWAIGVINDTGVTLNSTATNHEIHYMGVKYQEVV